MKINNNVVRVFHIDDITTVSKWLIEKNINTQCFMCDDIPQRKVGYKLLFNKKKEMEEFKKEWC